MTNQINVSEQSTKDLKKRVLFVITQSETGGAQQFLYTLVTHLDKDKYKIAVAAGPGELDATNYELLDQLEREMIKTIQLKHLQREVKLFSDLKAVFEIKKIIREFCPDTLFLLSSKAGFLGSLASKFIVHNSKFKVVYRIGGWSFNDPGPKWRRWAWLTLEKISAPWKDVIITNNKQDFDQAQVFKITPRHNLALVHNGIDVYKFESLPREEARLKIFEKVLKQSDKISQATHVVGTIANFYLTKDLPTLVSAAEHFKNNDSVAFVIIGDGPERPNIEKIIKEKSLEHKIFLLGQISDAKKYLPAFDIFVLPSIKEGFPWVVIEAMTARLPVIATRVGAVPEIIDNSKNGIIVDPARSEQIAGKIQELLNNDRLRQELGIQAHQTVLFKFSLEKMIREVESVIT